MLNEKLEEIRKEIEKTKNSDEYGKKGEEYFARLLEEYLEHNPPMRDPPAYIYVDHSIPYKDLGIDEDEDGEIDILVAYAFPDNMELLKRKSQKFDFRRHSA